MAPPKPRTIVYIDGYNFYYGAVKDTEWKWLNLDKYFRLIRNADQIVAIRYFTAIIDGEAAVRQREFLRALQTTPRVEVILGKYGEKEVRCGFVPACDPGGKPRYFSVPQEKRTDVNIAVHMLADAHDEKCDHVVLVTADSDLIPAVHMLRYRHPSLRITIYVPARDPSRWNGAAELRAIAHDAKELPLNMLRLAQFPRTLPDGSGGTITKPASW